jgi:hypothetical protein
MQELEKIKFEEFSKELYIEVSYQETPNIKKQEP